MKKKRLLSYASAILLSFSFVFQACTPEEVSIEEERSSYLDFFQTEMKGLFSLIDQGIRTQAREGKIKIRRVFESALSEKFGQDALASFEQTYKETQASSPLMKFEDYSAFQKLIISYNSYEEAISDLTQKIEHEEALLTEREDYVVMIEILHLFNNYPEAFEKFFRSYGEGKKRTKKCGWWESWGECAAGIIGGALEGIVGGCTSVGGTAAVVGAVGGPFTAAKGAVVGCIGGAVVGAIYGGLNGATGNCNGCNE